jgi:hypothetical protein
MKAVVVHQQATAVEKMWANQWAGLDSAVKTQFPTVVDWLVRVQKVFVIGDLTWGNIVAAISDAAKAAGQGGVVVLASGHGGSKDPDAAIINWDPTEPPGATHRRDWTPKLVGKGLFWDEPITKYTDSIPFGNPPTLQQEDEEKIKKKVQGWEALQKRHDAFDALQQIGKALHDNQINRLTFTVCSAGGSKNYMDRLAKHCQVHVACFKLLTEVLDDSVFGFSPGKARLVLERDAKTSNSGTNIPLARVSSPSLDDSAIAYVANP